jgi:GNAT superfamily N-acetyltransferase
MGIPKGKMESVITYLEMTEPPAAPAAAAPAGKLVLLRAEEPTVSFYRYLYNTVGGPWLWYERRLMDDETLSAIIRSADVEIYVLYVSGVPVGFGELDHRKKPDVELAYFGLMPEFIGRGLGRYLLRCMINEAWSRKPDRFWVHTCTEDHPSALNAYQRAGFAPYRQETEIIDDPRPLMGR